MYRHLLILIAAVGLALPGIVSVASAVTVVPATPPESLSPAAPLAVPTITPTASPSPGDITPPVTTAKGMGSRWRNDTATVQFTATDDASGVAATVYRVDGGEWRVGDQVQVRAPRDHSNDGEHAVEFYSVDNALNAETPQTVTVKIDTRPPHFAWKSVSPGIIRRIEPVACKFTIDEPHGRVTISYKITDEYTYFAASKAGLERGEGTRSVAITPRYKGGKGFVPGVYRIQFTVRDEAGNVTVSKRRSFRNYRAVSGGVWRRVGGAGRMVALTFDDGNNSAWASILSTLKRYKAHATFFPLGPYVASGASLARRTVQEGHACGVHGWTHSQMTRQSAGQIQSEWLRNAEPWWSATGYSPCTVLPPALRRHERLDDVGLGGDRLPPRDPLGRGPARLEPARCERHRESSALERASRRDRVHAPHAADGAGAADHPERPARTRLPGREPAGDVPRRRHAVGMPAAYASAVGHLTVTV